MQALLDLVLLRILSLSPQFVLFFASELDFLEVFERGGQLTQISSQLTVLLGKLFNFSSEQIHLIDCGSVAVSDVQ